MGNRVGFSSEDFDLRDWRLSIIVDNTSKVCFSPPCLPVMLFLKGRMIR